MPEAVYDFAAIHKQLLGEHKKNETVCDVCGMLRPMLWGIVMDCKKCSEGDHARNRRP